MLVSKATIYIPPRSSAIIKLRTNNNDEMSSIKLEEDVSIVPDRYYEESKKVSITPIATAKKNNMLTTVTNLHDSGVTIKKNQIIAKAEIPDKEMINSLNDMQVNQGNSKWDDADYAHFNVSLEERKKHLLEKLKLKENKLLDIENRRDRLMEVLLKYWKCFDYFGNRLPKCSTAIQHHIDTGDAEPIRSKCRPLNPIIADKVKGRLEDLEKRGIIRKSSSPWTSPILIFWKKNNDFRLVADYRRLSF